MSPRVFELVTNCNQLSEPPFGVAFALPKNVYPPDNHFMLPMCPQCNKISHPGRATAGMQAARTLSFQQHRELALYKCPAGNGWHAGHHSKTRKRPPVHEYRRDRMLTLPPQVLAREYTAYA